MSASGNDSESVVVAAMRLRIPQKCGRRAALMTSAAFFAIRRPMESNSPQSCSPCGAWWQLPLLLVLVLAAILLWHGRGIRNANRNG